MEFLGVGLTLLILDSCDRKMAEPTGSDAPHQLTRRIFLRGSNPVGDGAQCRTEIWRNIREFNENR